MTWLIGFTYKHGNMFSGEVLIIRGLTIKRYFCKSCLHPRITSLWLDYIIALTFVYYRYKACDLLPVSKNLSGGYSVKVTPLLIPNRVVKLYCADGTAWGPVWKSRSLPDYLL